MADGQHLWSDSEPGWTQLESTLEIMRVAVENSSFVFNSISQTCVWCAQICEICDIYVGTPLRSWRAVTIVKARCMFTHLWMKGNTEIHKKTSRKHEKTRNRPEIIKKTMMLKMNQCTYGDTHGIWGCIVDNKMVLKSCRMRTHESTRNENTRNPPEIIKNQWSWNVWTLHRVSRETGDDIWPHETKADSPLENTRNPPEIIENQWSWKWIRTRMETSWSIVND